eukprot:Colp12_sorted_trinity150504_noHs@9694
MDSQVSTESVVEATPLESFAKRLTDPTIHCKNGCGFFSSPAFSGYCSQCYQQLKGKKKLSVAVPQPSEDDQLSRLLQQELRKPPDSPVGKTKQATEDVMVKRLERAMKSNTISNFFKKVETQLQSLVATEQPTKITGGSTFSDFLKALRSPAAQDLVARTRGFIMRFMEAELSPDQQSEQVQVFQREMAERIRGHPIWKDASPRELENAIDGMEKFVMTKIYQHVFAPEGSHDSEKDQLLDRKVRLHRWVDHRHLEIHDPELPHVQKCFAVITKELNKMSTVRAPQEKLKCIVKACKAVFALLQQLTEGQPAGADEFMPLFV